MERGASPELLDAGTLGWFDRYAVYVTRNPDVWSFTLTLRGRPVAKAHGFFEDAFAFHLGYLEVTHPRHRRRGIGTRFLQIIVRELRRLGLIELSVSVVDHKLAELPFLNTILTDFGFRSLGHDPRHPNLVNYVLLLKGNATEHSADPQEPERT